jgi:ParB family chromosome partitioning protein
VKEVTRTGKREAGGAGAESVWESIGELGELLEPTGGSPTAGGKLQNVPVGKIRPSPYQPRTKFDEAKIAELGESLRDKGFAQPIVVRPVGEAYELVAGERRLRAAKKAGLESVPVIVRMSTDEEAEDLAVAENLHRENLSLAERVAMVSRAVDRHKTLTAVAKKFGMTVQWISKHNCLATAPDFVRELVSSGASEDLDGLYDVSREAQRDPAAAQARIASFKERGTSLRIRPSKADRNTKDGKPRAGKGARVLLADGASVVGNALELRTATGNIQVRFTKAALKELATAYKRLTPWKIEGAVPSRGRLLLLACENLAARRVFLACENFSKPHAQAPKPPGTWRSQRHGAHPIAHAAMAEEPVYLCVQCTESLSRRMDLPRRTPRPGVGRTFRERTP